MKVYSVYIIANKPNGVLYIGQTERLRIRVSQHKRKSHPNTFSARYNLNILVYYEKFKTKEEALTRERLMKKWNRDWKIRLIEEANPDWIDLFQNLK